VLPRTPGLTWRGLSSADFGPWYELVCRIQDYDEEHERVRSCDFEVLAKQPWVDLGADFLAAVDDDGVFRAVGRNAFRPGATETLAVTLVGGVDPTWRGRGLGRALLEWQRARAVQNIADLRAADPQAADLPARIGSYVESHVTSRARLLEAAGFRPTRWFTELRRKLARDTPAPAVLSAPGLAVRPFTADLSERVRLAHNEAFADHWAPNPHTPESWRTTMVEDEDFRPGMSYVVVDVTRADEPVVAYVLNAEYTADWEAQGFPEGYTEVLGVRRDWRKRGLATHLLELSAATFAAAGHPYATLGVDMDNPSGASSLYRSLGYEPAHDTTYWSVDA
jgi:ribosomal protein S18 acetylase RimI-like enzyme